MKTDFTVLVAALLLSVTAANAYTVKSPDGSLVLNTTGLSWSLDADGCTVLSDCVCDLSLPGASVSGMKVRRAVPGKTVTEHISSPFYRQEEFDFSYNSLKVFFKGGWGIEWRVSDEGAAYRFFSEIKGPEPVFVLDETAEFRFASDHSCILAYSENADRPFASACQNIYTRQNLSDGSHHPAFMPVCVDCGGVKVTVLESDLQSYPSMYAVTEGTSVCARFAKAGATFDKYAWRQQTYVKSREEYIAKTVGTRTYPWRIAAVSRNDTQMPVSNLVYALSERCRIGDLSWIKPGFSAWEWWNDWGLTGVDFRAGINMPTYGHYIDFAAANGLDYLILDEGWYKSSEGNMLRPVPELDIPGLVKYASERGVRLVLWCVFNVLDENLEEICSHYAEMGIAGFKVDFMDRPEQDAVEMIWRIAEACARHHLILDYHGIFPPTGLCRAYPNVLNYESVFGMEETRWNEDRKDMPAYEVTFPFLRQQCGSTDFTPGAMLNATREDYRPVYNNSMSMGTRARQAALYLVIDSPFTMLCDTPSRYEKEQETTDFLCSLPRCYEQTLCILGEMGEYVVMARRSGEDWYVGGLTNWTPRELEVPLGFLPEGEWDAQLFCDGANAGHTATDYSLTAMKLCGGSGSLPVKLAPGGGFVLKLKQHKN